MPTTFWSVYYWLHGFISMSLDFNIGNLNICTYTVPCSTGLYCVAVANFWVFGRAEQINIGMPDPPPESRNEGEAEEGNFPEQRSPLTD